MNKLIRKGSRSTVGSETGFTPGHSPHNKPTADVKLNGEIDSYCGVGRRYLYPMKKEFLPIIKEWRNKQIEVLRQKRPLTDEDQRKWWQKLRRDTHQQIFAIMAPARESKRISLIGYCGLTHIDYENKRGEISFLVDPERVLDRKLYREDFLSVLYLLCEHGFKRLELNKIYTETFCFRDYHISILVEFGFSLDGVLRKHYFWKGKYYDSLIHSILASEWEVRRKGN